MTSTLVGAAEPDEPSDEEMWLELYELNAQSKEGLLRLYRDLVLAQRKTIDQMLDFISLKYNSGDDDT